MSLRDLHPLVIFVFCLSVYKVTSLMCYSCVGSKTQSKCESDVKELRNGNDSKYAINCSVYAHITEPYCAIETYKKDGHINVIVRECSDGSFPFDVNISYSNGTACNKDGVCASFCNVSYCNGINQACPLASVSVSHITILALIATINFA